MHRVEAIYHLQITDDQILAKKHRLEEIEARLASNPELEQAHVELEEAKQALHACRGTLRDRELAVQSVEEKLRRNEQQLYGGSVKNPKALADLEEENAYLKRHKARLEDEQLEAMVAVEEAEARYESARSHWEQLQNQWEKEQQALQQEREELHHVIRELLQKRKALAATIAADDLTLYLDLRKRLHGLAVARIENGICSACQVGVPTSKHQQARQGDTLVFCSSCGRILYAE